MFVPIISVYTRMYAFVICMDQLLNNYNFAC